MNRDVKHIIQENRKRLDHLFQEYDPIFGIGSPIPRFPFFFTSMQRKPVLIPETMKEEEIVQEILSSGAKSAEDYSKMNGMNFKKLSETLSKLRLKHDFEFFAFTIIKVEDKITKQPVPFRLRYPQRKILKELERQRVARIPIRMNLPKSRQFGGSTLIQCYFFWMQTIVKENWHSAVAAHLDDAAKNIRGMYAYIAKNYPKELGTITLKPHEGSTKNKRVEETGSVIGVGSSQTPDNLRGYSFSMLHMSELAFYVSTQNKTPKDLAQTLSSTVPLEADTIIVRESTSKGVGGYWHQVCMSSLNGTSRYTLVFIPFYEIEIYHKEVDDYEEFISNMGDYDWQLWEKGATLESIFWYKEFMATEEYDEWRMKSEYPSDVLESFQSSGSRVFPEKYVNSSRRANTSPIFVGDVYADDLSGPDALKNITFEKVSNGNLWIWAFPEKDDKEKVLNRYCVSMDIGGTTDSADWSVIRVMDRFWLTDNGIPEMVATWRGHIDQDLLAWKAVQIAKMYDDALFIPEMNSMRDKNEDTEGSHFLTILDEIVDHYDNIFCRTKPEQIREGLPKLYGFHTNRQTKTMVINALKAALRDTAYFETDARACDEFQQYENKPDGSMGAVDGANDDIVMATAINVWCSLKYMDPPKIVKIDERKTYSKRVVGESSF